MPEFKAESTLFNAIMALRGVRDLLLCATSPGNDMHLCDPERLCCLVEVIADDLQRAADAYNALRKAG